MRRRLIVVAGAISVMVALAFLVPLIVLVRTVARDRAIASAERDASALAPVVALTREPDDLRVAMAATEAGRQNRLTVVLPDQTQLGARIARDEELALAARGNAFSASDADGVAVYSPVVIPSVGTTVVRVFVPNAQLTEGVTRATVFLVGLALLLVLAALVVSDRLGASLVRPVRRLAHAAERLGEGDLAQRVEPEGPPELAAVANAFNLLAGRVGELLASERELVADLSHRLRTPLTVLRHETDAVPDAVARERVRAATVELEDAVTGLIAEARRPISNDVRSVADVTAITRDRVSFWQALAEDQEREVVVDIEPEPAWVTTTASEFEAAIDALLGNVFEHTVDGTRFGVSVHRADGNVVVAVDDAGPGVLETAVERGTSGGGSTGLGLDIVRRTAEAAGGALEIDRSELGGACFRMTLPLAR
jgi:signal transduction histidine kinase